MTGFRLFGDVATRWYSEKQMYMPAAFREDRLSVLHEFITGNSFATVVTSGSSGLLASHVPLHLDPTAGLGRLSGHLARSNPQAEDIAAGCDVLIVFQGPQAYISPSLYPSKREHGKVVPTWNYLAVHAYGVMRCFHDPDELIAHLNSLTDEHERNRPTPWRVSDAPAEFVRGATRAIVGFEMQIERLEGTWKLSQNRSVEDRHGVTSGLQAGSAAERAISELIPE